MPLTPLDIQNKEFRRAFRGYDEEQVDDFLDEITRDFEAALSECKGLRQELSKAMGELERYRSMEETLKGTLVTAQQAAEDVRASARKEADLIIREAQMKADRMIADARAAVDQIRREFEETQKQVEYFRSKMRGFLKAQLELFSEGAEPQGKEQDGE